jgi:hypothetical protein
VVLAQDGAEDNCPAAAPGPAEAGTQSGDQTSRRSRSRQSTPGLASSPPEPESSELESSRSPEKALRSSGATTHSVPTRRALSLPVRT